MNPNGTTNLALCCGALPQRWNIHYGTMLVAFGDELFVRFLRIS